MFRHVCSCPAEGIFIPYSYAISCLSFDEYIYKVYRMNSDFRIKASGICYISVFSGRKGEGFINLKAFFGCVIRENNRRGVYSRDGLFWFHGC